MAAQEASASASAIPSSSDNVGGELASTLKQQQQQEAPKERRSSVSMLRGKLDATQIYEPPNFSLNQDTDVPPPVVRDRLVVEDYPKHTISTAWIKMVKQGLSEWLRMPVIVCRGTEDGPVVGITAAVHGNELNGVPCIHRVVSEIDVNKLRGTVVAVPCVNVSGYLKFQREFADGRDLNRLFPGREDGFSSQVYAYQLMNKVISQFNYLIDLHTASFGRVNSYYVRADMNDPVSAIMARLQQPQIVLHNSGQDGTLRSAASARGIRAITVEIGNPQLFQSQYVQVSQRFLIWSLIVFIVVYSFIPVAYPNVLLDVYIVVLHRCDAYLGSLGNVYPGLPTCSRWPGRSVRSSKHHFVFKRILGNVFASGEKVVRCCQPTNCYKYRFTLKRVVFWRCILEWIPSSERETWLLA